MSKISLTNLVNLNNQTTAVNAINANNAVLTAALDNTVSRDGTSPNTMSASLDMNSNRILNLPAPSSSFEPLRLADATTLNGGGTITAQPLPAGGTANQVLVKNSASNYDVGWQTAASLPGVSSNTTPLPTGFISGMVMSNDIANPLTTLNITAGTCRDSTDSINIKVSSAYLKNTAGVWSAGSSVGGLDSGTVANNTWYHVFAIIRLDIGTTDYLFSTSATAPVLPANYTKFFRIGSFRTNSSGQILAFSQVGNTFIWKAEDGTGTAFLNGSIGVTSSLIQPTVPTGVQVEALLRPQIGPTTASTNVLISPPEQNDQSVAVAVNLQATGVGTTAAGELRVRTNTSGQVRIRSNVIIPTYISTYGWTEL